MQHVKPVKKLIINNLHLRYNLNHGNIRERAIEIATGGDHYFETNNDSSVIFCHRNDQAVIKTPHFGQKTVQLGHFSMK